jgi:excisionase family DNA binding protein
MEPLSFEQLPQAVSQLSKKLDAIERLLQSSSDNHSEKPDLLLTIEGAAEFLTLTKATLYSKVSKGEIPFMKRSKRLYFSRTELMDYVKGGKQRTIEEVQADASEFLISKKG